MQEKYFPDMEIINSDIEDKILNIVNKIDFNKYNKNDVINALQKDSCSIEDFCALISPAAKELIEPIAKKQNLKEKGSLEKMYIFSLRYIFQTIAKIIVFIVVLIAKIISKEQNLI